MAGTLVPIGIVGSDELLELARKVGWHECHAMGALVYIWEKSQHRLIVRATPRQIGLWARVRDEEEEARLVSALCSVDVGLGRRVGKKVEIMFNEKEVEKLRKYREAGSEGGKTTRKNWKDFKKRGQDAEPNATANATASGVANGTANATPPSRTRSRSAPSRSPTRTDPSPIRTRHRSDPSADSGGASPDAASGVSARSPSGSHAGTAGPQPGGPDAPSGAPDTGPSARGEAEAGKGGRTRLKMPKPDPAMCSPLSPALRDRPTVGAPEDFSAYTSSHIHGGGDVA